MWDMNVRKLMICISAIWFVQAMAFSGMSDFAASGVFADGSFHVGCNYWASHAGMYMWRNWEPQIVERDIAELSGYGVNMMRVFPLWPDFQPLTRQLGGGGSDFGLLQGDGPLKNPAGVDEEMIRRFRLLCDVAAKHDVKLVVGLLTGWMSGRLFVPPAFADRDVITDPEALEYEVKFVRHFVRALKDHPAIIAWDFGNECDCMGPANGPQSWVWLNAIGSAIRMEDPSRPVIAGMHGGSNMPREPFSLVRQGEAADVLTTHPYPLFTPECARGPFNTMRSILHPTAESIFYAGLTGRPTFVEEAGDLGRCTASETRAAGNMRAAMFSAWANGLGAYLWWCGFDQQHLDFPPYNRNAVERELGLFTKDYVAKPQLKAIREFTSFLKGFPHAALPPRRIDAVCLVSESEPAWKQALGAYLLARQAGFDLAFASAERPLPDVPLYVLPSGDGIDPYTFNAWSAVLAKVRSGATLLVSKGGETRYSGYREATGNEIDCFYQKPSSGVFAFAEWPERKIAWNDAATVKVLSRESETLAETDGNPMVTAHRLGKGCVVAVNFAIESDSVTRSDCFFGEDLNPRYLVYRKAAAIAGISRCIRRDHPGVVVTEHRLESGKTLCVAVNCEDRALSVPLEPKGRLARVYRGTANGTTFRFEANDAAVFEVEPQE